MSLPLSAVHLHISSILAIVLCSCFSFLWGKLLSTLSVRESYKSTTQSFHFILQLSQYFARGQFHFTVVLRLQVRRHRGHIMWQNSQHFLKFSACTNVMMFLPEVMYVQVAWLRFPFPPFFFSVLSALDFVKLLLLLFLVPHGETEHIQIESRPCSTASSRKWGRRWDIRRHRDWWPSANIGSNRNRGPYIQVATQQMGPLPALWHWKKATLYRELHSSQLGKVNHTCKDCIQLGAWHVIYASHSVPSPYVS